MATASPNIAGLLDPSLVGDQLANQQQQALAQALMKAGLSPGGGTQMAGNVAIRNSPVGNIAKIAQLLSGQNLQQTANQGASDLAARQSAAMLPMFGMGAAQGQPGGMQGPQGMQGGGAGPMSVAGAPPASNMLSYMADPAAQMKMVMEQYSPLEIQKQMRAAGIDPGSMLGRQIIQQSIAKTNYIAPTEVRPGNLQLSAQTGEPTAYNPKVADGIQPTFSTTNGYTSANGSAPVAGYPDAAATVEKATAAGKGAGASENAMYPVTMPDGTTQQMTQAQAVAYANGGSQPSAYKFDVAPGTASQMRAQIAQSGDMGALGAFDAQQGKRVPGFNAGQSTVAAAAAKEAGADPQEDLTKRYGALKDSVAQAQTTNSYLDTIKQLAPTAATGKFSDKLDYVNALLAPFSESATDAKTANDLLNKYSNQIVTRLGQGGLGTDAARTILGSAYPNATMTKAAIGEAVDNIKAVNNMQMAKLSFLAPAGNGRDPTGYQQREQTFDTTADPRIFQIANMPPDQAQAYISRLPPAVQAELRQRAAALRQAGAL